MNTTAKTYVTLPGMLLAGVVVVLVLVSWQGLSGPLVFDDLPNLSTINSESPPDYRGFVFNNHSGALGRSVSMATFAINHKLRNDFNSFDLKLTNLMIHCANGFLLFSIISIVLQSANRTVHYRWIALVVSACWLLSPINAGVVFYVIQRMALLACFFVFAGILFYVLWRREKHSYRKLAYLILSIICLPLACLSKENGVLLPVFVLIIEIGFFARGRYYYLFRLALLSLFAGGCAAVYFFNGHDFLNYDYRSFTLIDRLSTQPIVILYYIRDLIAPVTADIGIFNDDFPIRRAPWNIATIGSSLAILLLLAMCFVGSADSKFRALKAGILFYFAGHVVESTALPLEMYFEHRNYIPSVGLYLAFVLLVHAACERSKYRRTLVVLIPSLMLIWFSIATYQKARDWTSWPHVVANLYRYHPTSARAGLEMASLLLQSNQVAAALHVNDRNAANNADQLLNVKLQRFYIFCRSNSPVGKTEYQALDGLIHPGGELGTSTAFELLLDWRDREGCPNVDFTHLMSRVTNMLDASLKAGSATALQVWHVEYYVIEHARTEGRLDFVRSRLRRSIEAGNIKASYYLNDVIDVNKEEER